MSERSGAVAPGLSRTADPLVDLARGAGLRPVSWAHWPESPGDTLTPLPGFIESTFSPLVAEVAQRCLGRAHGAPPVPPERGERTAVIICSAHGDATSAAVLARAVAGGGRVGPLLFFQAVPNSVAGHVASRWGLAGPVVCLGSAPAATAVAQLLIADGDANEALVVLAELSTMDNERDRAEAVLVAAEGERP